MHRILTVFLGLHWMAHFVLLGASAAGLSGLSATSGQLDLALSTVRFEAVLGTGMALAFGLTAVLFAWMTVTALLDRHPFPGETDEVARLAFATATGILTLQLLSGAGQPVAGLMATISLQLAALLASYVAVNAERRSVLIVSKEGDTETEATTMALGAAHNTMLTRISGRDGAEGTA